MNRPLNPHTFRTFDALAIFSMLQTCLMSALPFSRPLGLIVLSVVLLGTPLTSTAQPSSLSEQSEITMVTILPGEPVYTMFGHSALRVYDPVQNVDRLYNYGTFDFDDPFFIPKFAYGHLRYFLSVASYPGAVQVYKQQGRPVIEQKLNLSTEQKTALYRFLQTNAQPEHRYYQYDFFFDNCSTRIRDALEQALGEAVTFANHPSPDRSFRHLLDPYAADRPLLDLGFDLGLGTPADRTPSPREAMFLPEQLLEAFNNATVTREGAPRPLVTQTDTTYWISGYTSTPSTFDWPVPLAWLFLGLTLAWTGWQASTGRLPGEVGDAILLSVVGSIGAIGFFLWFISEHAVTQNNWNLLWAWPTHLIAAAVLLRRPGTYGLHLYLCATALIVAVLALGWTWLPQDLHAAVYPFMLALGIRAGWRALLPAVTKQSSSRTPSAA